MKRFVVLAALCSVACDGSKTSATPEPGPTCTSSTRQALSNTWLTGQGLANKQIALTFDDGPGSRTTELSAWLKSKNIRAGFFVNGKNLGGGTAALAQLVADGHVVGNHTQTHPTLTALDATQIVDELAQTDTLIAPFVPAQRFLFRAPFGAYDNNVFTALQASPMSKYVGDVHWEFGGNENVAADWACWQTQMRTTKACGDLHLAEIAAGAGQKGVVLMHDADYGNMANDDPDNGVGNTIALAKYLVGALETQGYTFVRIDEVPAIATLLPPLPPSSGDAGSDASTPPPVPTTPPTPGPSPPTPCP